MVKKITISQKNAQKAYQECPPEFKRTLAILLGGKEIKRDPLEFDSYEELCEADGIDPIRSLPYAEPQTLKEACLNGAFKLLTIFEAFNTRCGDTFDETWEPDYTDGKQWKHYPWGEYVPSLGAFDCSSTVCTHTLADLGARLCTDTAQKAKHIALKFNKEWNEFLNPQID